MRVIIVVDGVDGVDGIDWVDNALVDGLPVEDVEFVDEGVVGTLLVVLEAAGMMVAREAGRVDCPDINTAHACSTTNRISLATLLRG